MKPTRRLWATAGLAAGLAVFGVVLARPIVLGGTVLLGAWILSRQYLFSRAVARLADNLTVTQSPAAVGVRTDDTMPATLTAALDAPSRLACSVEGGLPTAANAASPLGADIDPGETSAAATVSIQWPIAGQHTFDQATVAVADGLFREQFPAGARDPPTVTVEPRGPRNVHVGEGGDPRVATYGEHDAGRFGSGLEPAGLREYTAGDTADRIDWNATARLGTPYVREYDAETDRRTLLVVDHRGPLADGPAGETELDYLREVALAIADSAKQLDDPLGLVTVGDGGVTERLAPSTQPDQYRHIRRLLFNLEPTTDPRGSNDDPDRSGTTAEESSPAKARYALATLDGDQSAFARRLRPFYAERQLYLERFGTRPLYSAVRTAIAHEQGPVFTVLCTDDSAPTELVETVKTASQNRSAVLVLLAPTVLYEQGGLSDVERAYERYVAFEELRRNLSRLDGVTALEVGPGDRLSAVLAAGRDRTARNRVGGEPS
jgi:uncharacterized protein (DUF58 family)